MADEEEKIEDDEPVVETPVLCQTPRQEPEETPEAEATR